MSNETKRGGQKQGQPAGAESKKHQGVRPGSTSQKKQQRQEDMERKPDKKSRVVGKKE